MKYWYPNSFAYQAEKNNNEVSYRFLSNRNFLIKYEELELQYRHSLGAGISHCFKNTEKLYVVFGSGGYSGVIFYYTESGNEIGSETFTDVSDRNHPRPKPPVNIQEYTCTVIRKSEQFVK